MFVGDHVCMFACLLANMFAIFYASVHRILILLKALKIKELTWLFALVVLIFKHVCMQTCLKDGMFACKHFCFFSWLYQEKDVSLHPKKIIFKRHRHGK